MPFWIGILGTIHKQTNPRNNMDPIHYEKIADKLMQFRGKLPKDDHLSDQFAKKQVEDMRSDIDAFLFYLDRFAQMDAQGVIR